LSLSYRIAPGVRILPGPAALTPQAGRVVLDEALVEALRAVDGRDLEGALGALSSVTPTPAAARATLACLVEAGLLERLGHPRPVPATALVARAEAVGPLVSAVVVAYNGVRWLEGLLPSLAAQTWRPLEVVVVDNGSMDDTADWVRREHPEVRLVRLEPGVSLAGGINRGMAEARGEHLFILNQDITLEPDAVAELVAVAESDPSCGAVSVKLRLMRAPGFLNGLGNHVEGRSWGSDIAMGHLDLGQFDGWREVPSSCFAATFVPRRAWEKVGEVDEGFPLYYEDAEWCYRARAHGLRILLAPSAVAYHAFGGSGDADGGLSPAKLRRVVHGRLRFALKLLPAPEAWQFVRTYLAEDLRALRFHVLRGRLRVAGAYAGAWGRTIADLPGIAGARRRLDGRRASPMSIRAALAHRLPETRLAGSAPRLTSSDVVRDYAPLIFSGRTRPMPEAYDPRRPLLLLVSQDVVDHRMAGPGLRYLEMARALSKRVDAVVAIPNRTSLEVPGLHLVSYDEKDPASLQVLVENADAAVVSGYMFAKFGFLQRTATRLVVDLYDPLVLENLHYHLGQEVDAQERLHGDAVRVTNEGIRLGDFFLCGSERQRDFWLGVLAANGRVNPRTYRSDDSLRRLVDVVGIGLPSRPAVPGPGLKGRHPGVPADARVVLWGGGIWNWLDPLTLVRAWPRVVARVPRAHLVFLGTSHPNPEVPRHEMAARTEALAASLDEARRTITFVQWVDLREREALLLEADVGVSLHPIHLETRYSVRARIIDCFWARLPVVVTDGDVASEWVRQHDVGRVVPPGDHEAVARALVEVLERPRVEWAPGYEALNDSLLWERLVEPLERYCLAGAPAAADRPRPGVGPPVPELPLPLPPPPGFALRAAEVLRRQGPLAFVRRGAASLRHRMLGP
jgi:GT2 family glycosyltransferase